MCLAPPLNTDFEAVSQLANVRLVLNSQVTEVWFRLDSETGQVENAEVRKPKYRNGSTETEVLKWEEKPPIDV